MKKKLFSICFQRWILLYFQSRETSCRQQHQCLVVKPGDLPKERNDGDVRWSIWFLGVRPCSQIYTSQKAPHCNWVICGDPTTAVRPGWCEKKIIHRILSRGMIRATTWLKSIRSLPHFKRFVTGNISALDCLSFTPKHLHRVITGAVVQEAPPKWGLNPTIPTATIPGVSILTGIKGAPVTKVHLWRKTEQRLDEMQQKKKEQANFSLRVKKSQEDVPTHLHWPIRVFPSVGDCCRSSHMMCRRQRDQEEEQQEHNRGGHDAQTHLCHFCSSCPLSASFIRF